MVYNYPEPTERSENSVANRPVDFIRIVSHQDFGRFVWREIGENTRQLSTNPMVELEIPESLVELALCFGTDSYERRAGILTQEPIRQHLD